MAHGGGKTVFFSNIPYTTTAGYLRKIFSRAGKVEDVELFTNSTSGTSIGAGIVTFEHPAAVKVALGELHDAEVDGRYMLVKPDDREGGGRKGTGKGQPEKTVFFNGVPFDTTEGFLRARFERVGSIVDFDLWRRPDGSSRGMGTCEFGTSEEADGAVERINGAVVDGRRLLVQMDSRPPAGDEAGKGGRVGAGKGCGGWPPGKGWSGGYKGSGKGSPDRRVFWSNASPDTTEGYLRARFEAVGTIVDFDFWRRADGSALGMGVCEFDHRLGAWRAFERLHGMVIDGTSLLIKQDDGGRAGASGSKGKGKGKWL